MKRGLARRQQTVVPRLGVDEKAIAKRPRYLTVVADLDQSRVLYLADDRRQESLDGFWPTLTAAQQAGIQAVAMDMWEDGPRFFRNPEHFKTAIYLLRRPGPLPTRNPVEPPKV